MKLKLLTFSLTDKETELKIPNVPQFLVYWRYAKTFNTRKPSESERSHLGVSCY